MSTPTTPIVINPTPKARFMADHNSVGHHRAIMSSDHFQQSSDVAMLEYAAQLALRTANMNDAATMGLKLQGAHEFLQTLRLLAETPRLPAPKVNLDNLPSNT